MSGGDENMFISQLNIPHATKKHKSSWLMMIQHTNNIINLSAIHSTACTNVMQFGHVAFLKDWRLNIKVNLSNQWGVVIAGDSRIQPNCYKLYQI